MARFMNTLTPEDHLRIAEAIRAAEAHTSGEIYCVVARASDGYFFPAAVSVSVASLAVGFIAALLLEAWWIDVRIPLFVAAQVLALGAALLVLGLVPSLRLLFVPRRLQYMRAHDNAAKQFLARNIHVTAARTGVLIFVSLAERYAEVVADSGINSRVHQDAWNGIVTGLIAQARRNRVAEGFIGAISVVGSLLSEHFPRRAEDRNELDDHLVEI